jgi:Ran GTPase-activating protein (RanGAP) involved in mRNA processing and transport
MQEVEDGDIEFLTKFHFWDELGWEGVRAIMDSLRTIAPAPYPHCKSIRLWKTFCEDEGVRAVCQYIEVAPNVQILELLDNKVTPLGCEFVSRIIHPKSNSQLKILKMDHNPFGSEGMIRLAEGMSMNKTLEQVSLTYCGIDSNGARAIFEVLINTQSSIQEFNLSGNNLGNKGIIWVLKGLKLVKNMKKIYLADNSFNADQEFLTALEDTLAFN